MPRFWFLYTSPYKNDPGFLGKKKLIPGVEQGKYKVNLEYLVPEDINVLKNIMRPCQKDTVE